MPIRVGFCVHLLLLTIDSHFCLFTSCGEPALFFQPLPLSRKNGTANKKKRCQLKRKTKKKKTALSSRTPQPAAIRNADTLAVTSGRTDFPDPTANHEHTREKQKRPEFSSWCCAAKSHKMPPKTTTDSKSLLFLTAAKIVSPSLSSPFLTRTELSKKVKIGSLLLFFLG
uniref:(northern house mosquito) hypothetical protein n=1 Tax=Culex pipiens TaxID=7175 RepID=A0A8D8I455_CULPI